MYLEKDVFTILTMPEVDIFSVVEMSLFLVSIFLHFPVIFFFSLFIVSFHFPHQLLPSLTSAASEADCYFAVGDSVSSFPPLPSQRLHLSYGHLLLPHPCWNSGSALFYLLLSTWPNHCAARPPLTAECRYGNRQSVGRGDTVLSQNQQEETLCSICGG